MAVQYKLLQNITSFTESFKNTHLDLKNIIKERLQNAHILLHAILGIFNLVNYPVLSDWPCLPLSLRVKSFFSTEQSSQCSSINFAFVTWPKCVLTLLLRSTHLGGSTWPKGHRRGTLRCKQSTGPIKADLWACAAALQWGWPAEYWWVATCCCVKLCAMVTALWLFLLKQSSFSVHVDRKCPAVEKKLRPNQNLQFPDLREQG